MLRRYLPKSLYARVVLIVILPIFMMQSVITYIFFARHWDLVTANLSANVAGQIAMITNLYEDNPEPEARRDIARRALEDLELSVRYDPRQGIPENDKLSVFNFYNVVFDRRLSARLEQPYWFNTQSWPAFVEVRVEIADGQLIFFAYRDRVFATTGPIFLFWLVSTSVLLVAIAMVFLRNQVRSILRLASAAEAFGRGRDAPDYRPTGATEVRKAGYAFIAMRERIRRQLDQRMTMLAGVSHDLRTPLTRIKLALAMLPETSEANELKNDVLEMERMVEAYLDFARNEAADEDPKSFDLVALIKEIAANVYREGREIEVETPNELVIDARRTALQRGVGNLVNNALRHGETVKVTARRTDRMIEITVDDDGPGIDPANYDDVFKPFTRLDDARNLNESGIGLGLTVVRDVARSHGGDVTLSRSLLGGLKASMELPL